MIIRLLSFETGILANKDLKPELTFFKKRSMSYIYS